MRGGRLRAASALLAIGVGLAGCGVPTDRSATSVNVPAGVFPDTEAGNDPLPEDGDLSLHPIYFLRNGLLVRVERQLSRPVYLKAVLDELLDGPTGLELATGLDTAIPAVTELDVTILGATNLVSIDLNDAFFSVEGSRLIDATAQLVLTGFGLQPDTQGVLFSRNGQPIALPRGDNTIDQVADGEIPPPLSVEDFANLLPRTVTDPEAPTPELALRR